MQLVFTGGLKGQVSQALKVLPTKTGAHYDYNTPPSATQCIFPADDGAWSAQMAFRLKEQTWQVSIGAGGFGLPKPGSHPGLPETLVGGASDDPNAVSLMVSSTASPDGQTGGVDETGYYTPQDHNDGAGTVVINPGLTSGTLDVWLTPSYPDPLVFHITGRWSCV